MNLRSKHLTGLCLIGVLLFCCCGKMSHTATSKESIDGDSYCNPILSPGAQPWATYYNGVYYYTQETEGKIRLWQTSDITNLSHATSKDIWIPTDKSNSQHLWGPEIHRIEDKWYIYFAADDGVMDNHQLYVLENTAPTPWEGTWEMKGRIKTDKDDNWAIHANVFKHKDIWYMTWSGWQTRRIETEIQCIYIAQMENPWTLASDRVRISQPEYEWERQWINADGSRTTYPIYVNESPQFFQPKNKEKVLIYYSASGNWTPFYALGLLTADANSNLLDAASWKKSDKPVFVQNSTDSVYAVGNICFVPSPNGKETYFLYHARAIPNEALGAIDSRSIHLQKLEWDANGLPLLGTALPTSSILVKPTK